RAKANLPLTLRISGDVELPENLQGRIKQRNGEIHMEVGLEEKMQVMKTVMSLPGLENIDLHLPTLEDLYTYFTGSMQLEAEK
ncbi:MAG: ABC transporter ATP-binding protein, partial [Motiliproteus sp.]|nr:ABC transporter ATP-binding protein [Motiliproteus sp.]